MNDLHKEIRQTLALVMAGGKGSRLMHLTETRAKPAVYFGGKFRIIDFALSNCLNSGIRKIGVLTQYKAHSLMRHLQRTWGFLKGELREFLELMPASQQFDDTMWYRGTADAIAQNMSIIKAHKPKHILILAGDHIYKMNYAVMLKQHVTSGAKCTVGCIEVPLKDASSFGVMSVDRTLAVTEFSEKPENPTPILGNPEKALASMGIYLFDTNFLLEALEHDFKNEASSHDFGKDIIPRAVKNRLVYAHPFSESCVKPSSEDEDYWRDVGTLESFWQANLDLTYPLPSFDLYSQDWPIITYQGSLPPAKLLYNEDQRKGIATDSLISGGCIVSGGRVNRSVLFFNVKINSFSEVDKTIVFPSCNIGRGAKIKNAIIEKGCQIPEGMRIGYDEEYDRKNFYRTETGLTIITPSMLKKIKK